MKIRNMKVCIAKRALLFCMAFFMIIGLNAQSLEFVMDMVHNNPGEERYVTKYIDPAYLISEGFTSIVPHWLVNCAITYDNFDKKVVKHKTEERLWIEEKAK